MRTSGQAEDDKHQVIAWRNQLLTELAEARARTLYGQYPHPAWVAEREGRVRDLGLKSQVFQEEAASLRRDERRGKSVSDPVTFEREFMIQAKGQLSGAVYAMIIKATETSLVAKKKTGEVMGGTGCLREGQKD
jgi:hypothetical protein